MKSSRLQTLVDCLRSAQPHESWAEGRPRVVDESHWLDKLDASVPTYGVSSLPGHLSTVGVPADEMASFQDDLISSHTIGAAPYLTDEQTRAVLLAKVTQWAAGGSGVSVELFDALVELAVDRHFKPAIPALDSYSSGDVIPAAHLAAAVLRARPGVRLRPKEGMSLINGSHIHAGLALANADRFDRQWDHVVSGLYAGGTVLGLRIEGTPQGPVGGELQAAPVTLSGQQHPVSVRASGEALQCLIAGVRDHRVAMERVLFGPSDNPLVTVDGLQSNASFIAPALALAGGALVDSLLMWSWVGVQRVTMVADALQREELPVVRIMQLTQIPKRLWARLESARLRHGVRTFATGASTSFGVEDFWTHGMHTELSISDLLDLLGEIADAELALAGAESSEWVRPWR